MALYMSLIQNNWFKFACFQSANLRGKEGKEVIEMPKSTTPKLSLQIIIIKHSDPD